MSDKSEKSVNMDEIDLLNYSFQSESSGNYGDIDIDAMLQLPSNSQQMMEAELDRQDEEIRRDIAEEERKAREEHMKVVVKHKCKPILIKTRPPGLRVFLQDLPPSFLFSDLSLEKHFGWTGKARLGGNDEDKKAMAGEGDILHLVRYLTHDVLSEQNVMITSREDFESVVNFILFKAIFCKDKTLHEVLRKCLFNLLEDYNYPWVMSVNQFVTILLNLGADQLLIHNPKFYESQYFCQKPAVVEFTVEDSVLTKSFPQAERERLLYLKQLFQLNSQIFALPAREEDYERVPPKVWKTFVFISSVVAQDETLVNSPVILNDITSLLHCLLSRLDKENDCQDLPDHFQTDGKNHPHNMLHLTSLIPSQFSNLKQLVSYMNIQLILGTSECDLPSECHVEDVMELISKDDSRLRREWCELDECEQYYCCWVLLHLLDIIVHLDGETYPVGSQRNLALRDVSTHIDKCHVQGKAKDSLAIDQDKVTMLASDLITRWKNIRNLADNVHKLKLEFADL